MKLSLDRLLWADALAALTAGLFILGLRHFLADLLQIPLGFVTFQGVANLVYAAYSLSLARRRERPAWMIRYLSTANLLYAALALGALCYFYPTCSALGVAFFMAEVVFIGGLGLLERRALQQTSESALSK